MQSKKQLLHCGLLLLALAAAGGCKAISAKLDEVDPEKRVEYKKSTSLPPLEVPPDLTSSTVDDTLAVPDITPGGTAIYSVYSGERSDPQAAQRENVLPGQDNMRVERDGNKRWLVLQGEPDQWWSKVREFWLQNGYLIKQEDPRIGIMETDWLENRADIPKDPIRSVLSKVFDNLYSAATRDKFRVRLERGQEPGVTELFLSHSGVEEVVQGESTLWQPRPSDPELEAEMLNRLIVFFGVDEKKAKTLLAREASAPRATLIKDGNGGITLTLQEDFSRAWRRTGLALDRIGFTVEDRDRSRGLYFVRYADPLKDQEKKEGFMSRMKFWDKDDKKPPTEQYLVSVASESDNTRDAQGGAGVAGGRTPGATIAVVNQDGARDDSETASRILTLLYEQLK
jgi:outer membrane protein assembly factor BamC